MSQNERKTAPLGSRLPVNAASKVPKSNPIPRTMKPANSLPKSSSQPAKAAKSTSDAKENAAGPRPGKPRAAAGQSASSRAVPPAAARRPRPVAAPDAAAAGAPLVRGPAAARGRGPPRPRGLATVGAPPVLAGEPGARQLHPAAVKAARRTGQLNLSSRDLTEVPEKVWHINEIDNEEAKQLTMSLDGGGGGEERWWDQVPLTKLLLCGNRLAQLSEELGLLTHLQTLDVHDNALTSLPDSIGRLEQLTKLVVSHNQLRQLPSQLFSVTSLRQLLADHNRLAELPESVGDCLDMELLDVSHNSLSRLPAGLGYLHKLNRLNASDNQLTALPDDIGSMTSLRHLELARNRLTTLPASLGQLYQLETLDLRQNQLTELPPLADCHALKELHLGYNQIKELSVDVIESLKSVIVLDLSNNKLESLPDEISSLQRLERLDLRNNDLSVAPLRLCLLPLLKSVQLEGNSMRSVRRDLLSRSTQQLLKHFRERLQGQAAVEGLLIPGLSEQTGAGSDVTDSQTPEQARLHDVHKMKSSRLLSHAGQKATEIPEDLLTMGQEAEVITVDFSKNLLTSIPDSLLLLSGHLSEVNVSGNRLTALPGLGQCPHLTYLNCGSNRLSSLPDGLAELKYLREVCIAMNRFSAIPSCLYAVQSLEILIASDNQITEIEAAPLKALPRLATLDLRNNSIAHVPYKLGTVTQLRSLSLEGNTFKQPRPTILAQGTASVLQYLRDRIPMAEREPE